jgi:KDO2-lipid IV(A) lauroyltransferase
MYCLHHGQPVPVEAVTIGQEHIFALQKEKRGAVVVTGHLGFWQIAPILMQRKSYPPLTMAMAEEPNQGTAEWERQFREKFKIVYTTSSPFATLELANVLRRGELVGMQMDRFAGGPHVLLPFCGKPAPFPLGPATLARATGTPLLPTFIIADADRTNCTFHVEAPIEVARTRDREADVREATERVVAVYERYVRTYPEQWFNFFDFWNPPAARKPPMNPSQLP